MLPGDKQAYLKMDMERFDYMWLLGGLYFYLKCMIR